MTPPKERRITPPTLGTSQARVQSMVCSIHDADDPSPVGNGDGGRHGPEGNARTDSRGTIPIGFLSPDLSSPPPAAPLARPCSRCNRLVTTDTYPSDAFSTSTLSRNPVIPESPSVLGVPSKLRIARNTLWPSKSRSPMSPISPAISVVPPSPPPPLAEKPVKIKRKTILEHIEGWWDLGLLRGGTVRGRTAPFPSSRKIIEESPSFV